MTPPASAMKKASAGETAAFTVRPGQGPGEGDVFRTIFESAAIGIFESTPEGKYIRANQALADMLGADSPEHLIASVNNIGDELYVDPGHRARFQEEIESRGAVTNLVTRSKRLDGSTFWSNETATALRNEAGEITSFVGTVADISELIEAQHAQRAAEEAYRRIFDNAVEGIYQSTPDGREIRANPAMARMNGYDTGAELKAAIGNLNKEWYVEPGRRQEFERLLAKDGRVENFVSETYRHKTGERIWVSENAWAVRDDKGEIEFYEGTIVEITDRKRAEDDLRLSEARFRDFGEPASDWNWETGPDHEFTYVSDRIQSFGDDPRKILGKTRWDFADDVDDDAEKWRAHRELLDHRKPFRDFVYSMARSGERVGFNSVSGKPFFDDDGTFLGYRGSARDVTELVRAEENLHQAMAKAKAASAAKSNFLANMSHELRTPLNAIIGFSEIIMRELFGPLGSDRYRGYMRDINESANLLLELITDILDFSKAESGMLEIEEQPVDLGDAIKWTLRIQAERAERRQVTLVEEIPVDLPYLRGDKRRIRQVLLNLVSNAIKFTDAGGRITLCAALDEDGGSVVSVEDTGIGIAEEDIARVLEPFVQLNRSRNRAQEGTGLGLPLCKQLVEFNGGTLSIESTLGEGTKVTMRFPAERSIAR